MSDTECDGRCVTHDLHQDRPTKVTSDAGNPVRSTRTNTYLTQPDTDKTRGKSMTISAILTDKPKSSTDIHLEIVFSRQAQRREDNPPSPLVNDTEITKQNSTPATWIQSVKRQRLRVA